MPIFAKSVCAVFICLPLFFYGSAAAAQSAAAGGDTADISAAAGLLYGGKPLLLPADSAPLTVMTDTGEQNFAVEIARSDEEKARGLMYRRQFPENRAMLFVFAPQERAVSMWMENTPLPLDMLFADKDGKIVYLYEDAEPFSRRLIPSLHPISYVAEVNAGQIKARGIKVGQKMRSSVIPAADSQ